MGVNVQEKCLFRVFRDCSIDLARWAWRTWPFDLEQSGSVCINSEPERMIVVSNFNIVETQTCPVHEEISSDTDQHHDDKFFLSFGV